MNRRMLLAIGLVLAFQAAFCPVAGAQVHVPVGPVGGGVYAPPVPMPLPPPPGPSFGGPSAGPTLESSFPRLSPLPRPAGALGNDTQQRSTTIPSRDPQPRRDEPEQEKEHRREAAPNGSWLVIDPPPEDAAEELPDAELDEDRDEEDEFPWRTVLGIGLVAVVLLGFWGSRD